MSESGETPDFAMRRAVEILAGIYERNQQRGDVPPPPVDKPIVLFNETIVFDVTKTRREDVERALGTAFAYPARGWHTYCVRGPDSMRLFASLFYSQDLLAAAELYVPKVDRAPRLEPRDLSFRFVPGEIAVGKPVTTLPEHFGHISGLAEKLGAYQDIFEARFPGGSAYAMGNEGTIERLALYTLRETQG
jgi:hypothetical protein